MSHREPQTRTEPHAGTVMGMRGCEAAATCGSDRPGHRLHAMQERLAGATASKWVDAIVVEIDGDGFATVAEFAGSGCAACGITTPSTACWSSARPSRCTTCTECSRTAVAASASRRPDRAGKARRAQAIGIASLIEPIIFSIAMTA